MVRVHSAPAILRASLKFAFRQKNTPWMSRTGNKENYFHAVRHLNVIHISFLEVSSNKISDELRAFCFHFQVYGPLKDLCASPTDDGLVEPNALDLIAS